MHIPPPPLLSQQEWEEAMTEMQSMGLGAGAGGPGVGADGPGVGAGGPGAETGGPGVGAGGAGTVYVYAH